MRVEGEMRRTATAVERCHQRRGAAAHARLIDQAAGKGVGALNVEGAPLVQLRLLHLHLCIRTLGGSMDRWRDRNATYIDGQIEAGQAPTAPSPSCIYVHTDIHVYTYIHGHRERDGEVKGEMARRMLGYVDT